MTSLRKQMIRQMDLKNLSHHTRRSYLNAVTGLTRHYRTSPEAITKEMIEDYLLYLKNDKGNAPASCSLVLTGLRFFYKHILDQELEIGFRLSKKPRKLPTVLTKDQVWKIINGPKNTKHRLALMNYRLNARPIVQVLSRAQKSGHCLKRRLAFCFSWVHRCAFPKTLF